MNKIANRVAICETLMAKAENDRDIVVLCSDSRGSASMTPFFDTYKEQAIEVGIAEQNLVSIAAGMAHVGKKPFAFSPACFITARSYEQAKIDVCYSNTNVKLIGISGGVSYGELGMSHQSAQDIACMCALPNMRVYLPSDRFQTQKLISALVEDDLPAYVRVGRNPVEDVYTQDDCPFVLNEAITHNFGSGKKHVVVVACGEMVAPSIEAAKALADTCQVSVLDMYCVKPLDTKTLLKACADAELVVSVEEHSPYGGLGAQIASVLSTNCPKRMVMMSLPDDHIITGKSPAIFAYYGLNGEGIKKKIEENL